MLRIDIPSTEYWDEKNEKFVKIKGTTLQLEHSLVSIAKWEAKWHKPYLTGLKKYEKTNEEVLDYIRCMTLTQNVDPSTYERMTPENLTAINDYVNDPATATWFNNNKVNKTSNEIITAELVYYWMITLNIPVEFQKWHINRLLTLIRVCNEKQQDPKTNKLNRQQLAQRNASLNAARRAAAHSKG